MDKLWAECMKQHHTAPDYIFCGIVRHGDYDGGEIAYICIGGPEEAVEKYPVVAVCCNLEILKALAVPAPDREFTAVEHQLFDFQ